MYNACMKSACSTRRRAPAWLMAALVACAALFFIGRVEPALHAQDPGPIVAVGGGTIGDAIYERMLALAGGSRAIVAEAAWRVPLMRFRGSRWR